MDAGSVAVSSYLCNVFRITMFPQEFDTPCNLYHRGGLFRGMCDRSNITLQDIQTSRVEADNNCVVLQR